MKTELEAVNYLLSVMNSSPVGDLETTLYPQVVAARAALSSASTSIQKTGWWFNQEYKFDLTPDETTKEIAIPLNILEVDVTSVNGIIKRGQKLYNAVQHTYQFDAPVTANMLLKLDFELLDEIVIDAIRYFAGIEIAEIEMEDSIKASKIEKFYVAALADMRKADLKVQRRNALRSPTSALIVQGARYRGRSVNPNFPGGNI